MTPRLSALPLLFGLMCCGSSILPAPSAPEPPPQGEWRVAWLPNGRSSLERSGPGTAWRLRIDHQGPERQLDLVCETLRGGTLESSEVLVSTPLLEVADVDHGTYHTLENVQASDSNHVNLRVTLIDLSRHLSGSENAYVQVTRWGERDEGRAISPDAVVAVPALSAKGDQASGPMSRSTGASVQGIEEEVLLSRWTKSFKDPAKGPSVESRLVLRLR